MVPLHEIVDACDSITARKSFNDYPGAKNGLQITNNGNVTRIGASVDAGLLNFNQAAQRGIDFLIVHHGIFWGPIAPIAGPTYQKLKTAFDSNIALYSNHLPLDAHPEIGNNVMLAKQLELELLGQFGTYEGRDIGWYAKNSMTRSELKSKLEKRFPNPIAIEYGSDKPGKVALMSGSGGDMIPQLASLGIDTLVTGECSQHHFNMAQELQINLYLCGHYATEIFAVQELAKIIANRFNLPWEFIDTDCPL